MEATPKAALFIYILHSEATDHLFVSVYDVYICEMSYHRVTTKAHKHAHTHAIIAVVTVILNVSFGNSMTSAVRFPKREESKGEELKKKPP